jgi:RNA polymerase sigma-70 factor (ECF subfamily)
VAKADRDRALLEGLRARAPDAFERLYDQFGHRAFGLALQVLGDRGAAEDAVQEAFLAIWQHAERLDPQRGQLAPLLLAVVHHKASDQLRRRTGHKLALLQTANGAATTPAADPAEAAVRELDRAVLLGAISVLPRKQQQTVQLAYFGGRSHSEIALATHAPLGTVKSRLRIALRRLRLIIGTGAQP